MFKSIIDLHCPNSRLDVILLPVECVLQASNILLYSKLTFLKNYWYIVALYYRNLYTNKPT